MARWRPWLRPLVELVPQPTSTSAWACTPVGTCLTASPHPSSESQSEKPLVTTGRAWRTILFSPPPSSPGLVLPTTPSRHCTQLSTYKKHLRQQVIFLSILAASHTYPNGNTTVFYEISPYRGRLFSMKSYQSRSSLLNERLERFSFKHCFSGCSSYSIS